MAAFSSPSVTSHPSPASGVFSDLEWARMYPKEQYPSSTWAKTCLFQFLLANGHPDDKVVGVMEKFKAKLFTPDAKCYQFTPLIIAVMQGKATIVKKIIEIATQEYTLNAQLKHTDVNGWTALHHAAIRSNEIYQLIKPLYESFEVLRTRTGASALNLRFLTDCEYPSLLQENVYFVEDGKELPILKMSSEELKEKLALEAYRTAIYYPPQSLKPLWKKKCVMETNFAIFAQLYRDLISSPPKLLVRSCVQIKDIDGEGNELVAGQDIPCGKGITTYGGGYSKKKFSSSFEEEVSMHSLDSIYRYHSINPTTIGNVSRFSNCGFPNTISVKMIAHGTSFPLFISLGIKTGEPIIWSYGSCPDLHYGKQFLFGRKEMREFFSEGFPVFQNAVQTAKNLPISPTYDKVTALVVKTVLSLGYLERARFPLYNPSAILDLHFSGIIKAQEWLGELYNMQNGTIVLWHKQTGRSNWYFHLFLKTIIDLDKAVEKIPAAKCAISEWVLVNIGHFSIMEFVKVFSSITASLKAQELGAETNWKTFLSGFDEFFVGYDWRNDPDAPLSLKNKISLMADVFHKQNMNPATVLAKLKQVAKDSGKGTEEEKVYKIFKVLIMGAMMGIDPK